MHFTKSQMSAYCIHVHVFNIKWIYWNTNMCSIKLTTNIKLSLLRRSLLTFVYNIYRKTFFLRKLGAKLTELRTVY